MGNNISCGNTNGASQWGQNPTLDLMRIIGSPMAAPKEPFEASDRFDLTGLYNLAFENRVELLFLEALERLGRLSGLEEKKQEMELRALTTRKIAAETSWILSRAGIRHAVFKSIKPYPATPNDTDIVCLGDEPEYQKAIQALIQAHYAIQVTAPMQTVLYHPWGEGKIGHGKKGGTYYIDLYRGVAVDYYEYVNKAALKEYCQLRDIEGIQTVLLAPEPELAIVMFHNVFPEKTFNLEHYYLCLYGMASPEFDLNLFINFVENNAMTLGVRCNLSVIEGLHQAAFGPVPEQVEFLLNRWGRDRLILDTLAAGSYQTTFIFPAITFWQVFLSKLKDPFSRRSLVRQLFHMSNPIFFWEALKSACNRTFKTDFYLHQ